MPLKQRLKDGWDFLWNSDSISSWIALLLICFVLVRFIIFPILGLILGGTQLPLVVVESSSMEHNGDFDKWWSEKGSWYEQKNFTKEEVKEWSFNNGLDKGDIVLSRKLKEYANYNVGDVIIFKTPSQKTPIIHRVIGKEQNFYVVKTKGDNNKEQNFYENDVKEDYILAKAIFRVPKLGWIKLVFVEALKTLQSVNQVK